MTLWRVRATIEDKPGFLAVLAASLALRSVNILAVHVHTTEAGAIDDFLVDAPDETTEQELLAAVERGRGRQAWVARADPHALVDTPTRTADLAAHLARNPAAVGEALGELLGARAIWQPVDSGFGIDGTRLRLPAPEGGSWLVERPAPSFTPAEYARAQALLAVPPAVAAGRGDGGVERRTLLLTDGRELVVRRAHAQDLAAVRAMHGRCSSAILQRRYLSGGGTTDHRLSRLLSPASGASLVAETTKGEVAAMANLIGEGVQAEAALLVEDGWQHLGLGTALLRSSMALAAEAGFDAVVVYTGADNTAMLRTLRRLARQGSVRPRTEHDGALVMITLPLGPAAAHRPAAPV